MNLGSGSIEVQSSGLKFNILRMHRDSSHCPKHACRHIYTKLVDNPGGYHIYMMQGCHTPPSPPTPCMVSPLACQVGSCLVPVWSCLASSPPPPPLWSGACGLLGWPRPACGGAVCSTDVWYGCYRLLVVMSSLRALSPPPPCGVGPVVVLVGPAPPVWGSVFYKDMYGMVAAAC